MCDLCSLHLNQIFERISWTDTFFSDVKMKCHLTIGKMLLQCQTTDIRGYQTHLIRGGDRINHPDECGMPTVDMF